VTVERSDAAMPRSRLLTRVGDYAIITICFLAVAGVAFQIFCVARFFYEYPRFLKAFPERHVEATAAIERIYAYYQEHGAWPPNDDDQSPVKQWLPPDWQYSGDGAVGPVLWLHGPWHLILSYAFQVPDHGTVSNIWTFSNEGDKTAFPARVQYSLKATP
jgi:hypothetical protein